jgi:hypothetical protein
MEQNFWFSWSCLDSFLLGPFARFGSCFLVSSLWGCSCFVAWAKAAARPTASFSPAALGDRAQALSFSPVGFLFGHGCVAGFDFAAKAWSSWAKILRLNAQLSRAYHCVSLSLCLSRCRTDSFLHSAATTCSSPIVLLPRAYSCFLSHCHKGVCARWTSWQCRWPVFSSYCASVPDLMSWYSLCRCDCVVSDLVKIVTGESRYCSWATGSKAQVFRVFILPLWWVFGHTQQVVDEMFVRQWKVLLIYFSCHSGVACTVLSFCCVSIFLSWFWGSIAWL